MPMLELLNEVEGKCLDPKSLTYDIMDKTVALVMRNDLQPIFNFFNTSSLKADFLKYAQGENAVKGYADLDPDEIYIKGIVDGMRVFYTFMQHIIKTHEMEGVL